MAKYDPQRPKQQVSVDDPAPVDAILDSRSDRNRRATTDAEEPKGYVESTGSAEPAGNAEPSVATEVSGSSPAEPLASLVEAPGELPPAVVGASEVPVALPPQEGTANRAVLGAAITGALVALFGYLWFRRRQSH